MQGDACDRPPAAAALIGEILELADRLRTALDAPCASRGVSPSRFALISAIHGSGESGCSQTELATQLRLSESNVSTLVEGLRKSGLVFRFRSKTDRRRSVLLLTDAGTAVVRGLIEARELTADGLVQSLQIQQVATLRELLRQLTVRMSAEALPIDQTTDLAPLRRAS